MPQLTMNAAPSPAATPSQLTLTVAERESVAEGVVALTLADPAGKRLPDWTPGAHIDLVLPEGGTRQYSLCGDRWDAYTYRVGVLHERNGRGGSDFVHRQLSEGTHVGVGGPRNNFRLAPAQRYVFVAGGIGITPMLPMLQSAALMGAEAELLYLGRSRKTMPFLGELASYGDNVKVLPKDECGPVDLPSLLGDYLPGTKVYVCGPQRMLDSITEHCAGWPEGSLRTEHFAAKQQGAPARREAFEVELSRSGKTLVVEPGISVLDAIQSVGVNVLSSCRTGTCGTCEATVIAGIPDHRDSILTEAEQTAGDCMFPCVSRSCTDRLVLDL